uniref:Uncharacterized protein n=1 Tax=Anguilla anguilla TaxID=7936 RepID=A0A0E9W7E7_ANGAN
MQFFVCRLPLVPDFLFFFFDWTSVTLQLDTLQCVQFFL